MLRLRQRTVHHPAKFQPEEDERLKNIINDIGTHNWVTVASLMPGRNVKQCIERWRFLTARRIAGKEWTLEEDNLLKEKVAEFGKKWSIILKFFPNRNENNIKTRYQYLARQAAKQEPVKIVEVYQNHNETEPEAENAIDEILSRIGLDSLDYEWWNQSSEFFPL